MSTAIANRINLGFKKCDLPYKAVHVPAEDESVDDMIEITTMGVPTSLSLQIGYDYLAVNQYGYENGELAWMKDVGMFKRDEAAAAIACLIRSVMEG